MKKVIILSIAFIALMYFSGCHGKSGQKSNEADTTEVSSVPDTIKKLYSGNMLTSEITFRNGVRHGLTKTYYPSGRLRQTFWYENGLREDTAVWYYEDGKVFRKTPYKNDTINGTQIQYYKSGRVKAKLEFEKGLRKPYLEEFNSDGTLITDYPEVVIETIDNYKTDGTYTIKLRLSKKDVKANFYKGGYVNGLFDPGKVKKINDSEYTGLIRLRKTDTQQPDFVEIIAEISTPMGNKLLVNKKINLPYNDLK